MKDMRRVAGHEIGAPAEHFGRDPALPGRRANRHVGAPMGESKHEIAGLAEAANLIDQPRRGALSKGRVGDSQAPGTGGKLARVVG
jgi:hypothetical protein